MNTQEVLCSRWNLVLQVKTVLVSLSQLSGLGKFPNLWTPRKNGPFWMVANQPNLPGENKGERQKRKQTLLKGHHKPLTKELSIKQRWCYILMLPRISYTTLKLQKQTNTVVFERQVFLSLLSTEHIRWYNSVSSGFGVRKQVGELVKSFSKFVIHST